MRCGYCGEIVSGCKIGDIVFHVENKTRLFGMFDYTEVYHFGSYDRIKEDYYEKPTKIIKTKIISNWSNWKKKTAASPSLAGSIPSLVQK